MFPLQRATVIKMVNLLLKTKQVRHVVISRIARQRRITVKLAFIGWRKPSHFMQERRHFIIKKFTAITEGETGGSPTNFPVSIAIALVWKS